LAQDSQISVYVDSPSRSHPPTYLSGLIFQETPPTLSTECNFYPTMCTCLESGSACVWCNKCFLDHSQTSIYCNESGNAVTLIPSGCPTLAPSEAPTESPTEVPTGPPTESPTGEPTTEAPTQEPTAPPTNSPTELGFSCGQLNVPCQCIGFSECGWCGDQFCFERSNQSLACPSFTETSINCNGEFAVDDLTERTLISAIVLLVTGCSLFVGVLILFFVMRLNACAPPPPIDPRADANL